MRRLLIPLLAFASLSAQQPQYASKAELKFPEGYRGWYFIGSNLGVSYSPEAGPDPSFKNLYIPKQAADAFLRTGVFPEKTMVVMEIYRSASDAAPAKHGKFQGQFVGIEVAVKDSQAVPESWAYYKFFDSKLAKTPTAKAFAKNACWSCHKEHAAKDNVFVQFYPRLRDSE
jgi:hypothetical protein